MKIKTFTHLLLIITTLFYGCSKCEEVTGRTEIVNPSEIAKLFPYLEYEKITFLKNRKDTIIFQNLGLQTTYNYTNTQTDCPEKTPLEQKYMQFIDSAYGNSFYLINYRTAALNYLFNVTINNETVANSEVIDFRIHEPIISTIILGKKYDSISVWKNQKLDSVMFKTIKGGVLKFTSNGNLFELIP